MAKLLGDEGQGYARRDENGREGVAQLLDFVAGGLASGVPGQLLLAGFQEVLLQR